jgi:hypothetical protein
LAGIQFVGWDHNFENEMREYVHLYVTIVVSSGLSADYFHGPPPSSILTTDGMDDFLSISIIDSTEEDFILKVFSLKPLNDNLVNKIFQNVTDIKRFEWDSYPKLNNVPFPKVKLDNRLYYLNAWENALSTMESEMLSGRNICNLIKKDVENNGNKDKYFGLIFQHQ